MSKIREFLSAPTEEWIYRGKTAALVYAGLILLTGFIYIVAVLAGGAYGTAFVGMLATIGGCGLAALAWGGFHFAALVLDDSEEVGRLHDRVDSVESVMEMHNAQRDLSATLVDDLSALVTGKLEESRYPRIAMAAGEGPNDDVDDIAPAEAPEDIPDPHEADAPVSHEPTQAERFAAALDAGDLLTCRRLMPALVAETSDTEADACRAKLHTLAAGKSAALRTTFATALRKGDFEAALNAGAEIEQLLPDSRMARDFRSLRPRVEQRAGRSVRPNKALS